MKNTLKIILLLLVACGVYLFVFYKTPEQRVFEKTLAAAQAGNAEAALAVAGLYAHGTGVKPNGAQAAEWYRKAAADGSAEAAWKLADLYIQGTLVPQDLEEALAYIQLAARQGSARAQSELGRFYAEGLANLPVNRGEALYWWLQAAEAGDESAQTAEQDARLEEPELYEEVKRFLSVVKRAQEGDSSARLEAGQGFRLGYPVARNDEEALRWFTLAWEEGEKLPQAAYELAQMYQKGEGVEKNEARAMELFGAAAQAKNPDAQYTLGTFAYGANPPKYEDAFAWFSNAAAGGSAQAQYMTGFMLMQGQGTNLSVPLAVKFFRDAAEQNYVAAQYVLGQIYWKGLGVPADKKAGEEWLQRAADNGNESAKALLAEK